MKRFRNILFVAGLDDGPVPGYFFDRTLQLARRNEASLTLIDIGRESRPFPEILPEMLEAILRERRHLLDRLAGIAREQGVQAETVLAVGKPFLEIIRHVQRSKNDLVVIDGGHTRGAGGVIDSTTMHLLRKCPCTVWVVRPQTENKYARVLAAIDPDAADPKKDSLNRKIMELAISMAKLERSVLHVVHVWEFLGTPVGASGEVWKQWEVATRSEIRRQLYEFLAGYDLGSEPQVHLAVGRAATAISELADEKQVDLLVMGTVCRTGIRGFLIGNTAEGVLRRVDCSLLTVKPEGFVSPI